MTEEYAAPYIFALVDTAVLLFVSIFYIVTLSDLECDYINAPTCCGRLNKIVIPEAVLVGLMVFGFIIYTCFGSLIFSVPMFAWLIYKIVTKPPGQISYFDPAEIYNRDQLKKHTYEAVVKMIFHLLGFFFYLYCMIIVLVADDPLEEGKLPPFMHDAGSM